MNEKISQLPVVTNVVNTDLVVVVASDNTSQTTVENFLSNTIPLMIALG